MITIIELARNRDGVTGRPVRRAELGSWKAAWKCYEGDFLHSKECPGTKVIRTGTLHHQSGVIQHWGNDADDARHICARFE